MSDAAPAFDNSYVALEQRVFVWSPLGTMATAGILFLLLSGSYVGLAVLFHIPVIGGRSGHLDIEAGVFQAVILALLVATVLGMQRYISLREVADEPDFSKISSTASAAATIIGPTSLSRVRWANAAGALAGMALAYAVIPYYLLQQHPALFAWHFVVTVFLGAMFGRGVLITALGGRAFAHLIEHELKVDLLHVDRLTVIGRRSARNAFVWFTTAAVICLFFVSGGVGDTTYLIIAVCACMGLYLFFRPMEHVHRRIHREKLHELDRVRNEIEKILPDAERDASAATRLQGLLAYEARIQAVHEWPFDQSTMVRVAAYVLIPAIPWFGEAFVSDIVQKLAH